MAPGNLDRFPRGFFNDVDRWQRQDPHVTWRDGLLIAHCAAVWTICALSTRALLASLGHSALRSPALWCLIAMTAWMTLPPLQLLIPQPAIRRALRMAVAASSLATSTACLGFLHGIAARAPAPSQRLDDMWIVILSAIGVLILGAVGLLALLRPTAMEPTG
ncbi:pre-mRNA-splicing factor [Actinomyces bowdenii]|uniref:Pre-mRNA-splicing factor n=1 Tax=Actinomyces bowdenii TaxID=131109 RepID=A0A853ENF1_9ACTO|nr:pre-mRNA-splicing factor [Actinomyces bowdenii]MBF0697113.1 pre-mRNA-splicing factor [Actinomyces bowdenii]NYS69286.1 pre-mRNA-splicing factor [Actinomyces bowdenii]